MARLLLESKATTWPYCTHTPWEQMYRAARTKMAPGPEWTKGRPPTAWKMTALRRQNVRLAHIPTSRTSLTTAPTPGSKEMDQRLTTWSTSRRTWPSSQELATHTSPGWTTVGGQREVATGPSLCLTPHNTYAIGPRAKEPGPYWASLQATEDIPRVFTKA